MLQSLGVGGTSYLQLAASQPLLMNSKEKRQQIIRCYIVGLRHRGCAITTQRMTQQHNKTTRTQSDQGLQATADELCIGMAQPIHMGYPYIRVYTVYTVCHLSRYTCLHIWFLHGEHGEHGVLREPSRHPVVTTLRI